ncbi:uncharacterized protein LOC118202237 [Stegodyphus dumicola]|uniref:uncharacterized protein LOC118202237 n=1 Tax=Stegodyphus dumicola TaxID=202533 RepID=UPI0015ABFF15|nr:uncharacterized protein LOC118202237 [Stegodyphus dumicola]
MPAILPGEHPLVKSLVLEDHRRNGHAGVSYTLNSLREKYRLLCGRRAVKHVLRSCIICKRFSAKDNNNPPTAPQSSDRVQDAAAFQITGMDFAGPVILRDNSKSWIALFTCAVYRAAHLELVTSISTETFLLAFHRFVARRGKLSVVYSDNGTNFKGAASAFAFIDFEKIFLEAREHITWKFIPPNAPWWGGWWERLVGMMKIILKKTLGRASLSYEEMITALCNCVAILNERPLTTVSPDHTRP